MNRIVVAIVCCALLVAFLGACGSSPTLVPATPTSQVEIANPASQACIAAGGTLAIEARGDGGQIGVCYFEDNRQCEEWALFRGECPAGGLKVTGYVTPAGRYCAITGGEYQVTGSSGAQEQGTCMFKNGKACDAWEYWLGACTPETGTMPTSFLDPFAYCAAAGTIDVPDDRYTGTDLPDSVVQAMVRQGIVSADAPPDFQKNAVWRCMDGNVWLCHFGANLPCQEKADTSQEPSAEMNDFCTANPTAEVIPAAAIGRTTIYEWRCSAGTPAIVKQVLTADAQGYLAEFWYQLSPQ